ncbi:thioredoxin domain-containing protein 16 isoform X1 [Syngnathus typhle]|uniref:thioredoxin domain-containing protein 16 isoform X1 n=1 Tax=Syngnathus typhle TaxID=161592 RepID=UPI002A6A2581|nr:thioredoxin domain-containing protein 16 isoform X1 [Syngnathus typhle]XP_061128391.1 thioredoxin domain-containing protein 16 isoform X1 [Syngnathus typhle]XP_061128392.1 thioredoxin domain-containing protein 16 isoform X1 [Syngnathus typhle]
MMWLRVTFLLLFTNAVGCTDIFNTSGLLLEFTAVDFYEKINSGKMIFIYFENQVSQSISLFLGELKKSADVLKDYGILVGKINCNKEMVPSYCMKETAQHTAFLFRDGKEFVNFDLDTVFDVNSVVSEVLFAILRDEVKYVHSDADLSVMEKSVKGKKDIVLSYVNSLGTQEHRSVMETAYVYGSKYQFILITGGPVLKHLGVHRASPLSRVWFLHCTAPYSERCPLTPMRTPLSTLSLHTFLQLMEAPLLAEVYKDPSAVARPQFPYQQTPQVFLFSNSETEQLDRDTANTLAWRLRGIALLTLVHRKSPAVKTPVEYNVAYKLPDKGFEVKYLTLDNLDALLELFYHHEADEMQDEELEGEECDTEDNVSNGDLEDEIVASVYENRGHLVHMDSITQLTSDDFPNAVAQSGLTVVLFYLKWDAVSTAFISSFTEVAERLGDAGVVDVHMSAVDCGEWTDLCAAQPVGSRPVPFKPITAFPSVLLLSPQELIQEYRGMLGCEPLLRFILLSRPSSPQILSTQQEVTSFLHVTPHHELAGFIPDRIVGLFSSHAHAAGLSAFNEAAKSLRGRVLSALLTDVLAQEWAADLSVNLPAVLVFPSWRRDSQPSVLTLFSSVDNLVSQIDAALLHPLPELTVENLPSFLSLGKALLLLFVGEEEDEIGLRQNKALLEEMKGVLELGGERMEPYLTCWIHLGRTPAGMSVLGSYLGSMPPLPALVLTHLPSGHEVYEYPPNTPITAQSVLQWLQRVEEARESPAGMLGKDDWPPSVEFYDFLKIMDEEEPGFAKQRGPKKQEKEVEMDEAGLDVEEGTTDSSYRTPHHSEL